MLSEDIRNLITVADGYADRTGLPPEIWTMVKQQTAVLADRLQTFEQSAEIGAAGKTTELPDNVVRLTSARRSRPRSQTGGDAA